MTYVRLPRIHIHIAKRAFAIQLRFVTHDVYIHREIAEFGQKSRKPPIRRTSPPIHGAFSQIAKLHQILSTFWGTYHS